MPDRSSSRQLLDDAGLVAMSPCGHWWVYPCHMTKEQMFDVARFSLIAVCSFCEEKRLRRVSVKPHVPTSRLN